MRKKVCAHPSNITKKRGRPKKGSKNSPHESGWFMLVHPRSGRILGVQPMENPENNESRYLH